MPPSATLVIVPGGPYVVAQAIAASTNSAKPSHVRRWERSRRRGPSVEVTTGKHSACSSWSDCEAALLDEVFVR